MPSPNRFIADTMLGKLARWLRILGYDTLYYRQVEDDALLQIARSQHRWLLTRDALMIKEQRPLNCTFIHDDHLREQLKQVVMELELKMHRPLIRCLECNDELTPLPKDQARSLVPEYVYQTQQQFSRCSTCLRVYWAGTHYQRIRERLTDLFPNQKQHD
jgi:uncharacterized protein with PIN domain